MKQFHSRTAPEAEFSLFSGEEAGRAAWLNRCEHRGVGGSETTADPCALRSDGCGAFVRSAGSGAGTDLQAIPGCVLRLACMKDEGWVSRFRQEDGLNEPVE